MRLISNFFHFSNKHEKSYCLDGVAYGFEAFAIAKICQEFQGKGPTLYIARDDTKLQDIAHVLTFLNPDLEILQFPAWDCLPYDRVSPSNAVLSYRLATLAKLITLKEKSYPFVVLTSANAIIQKTLPADFFQAQFFVIKTGQKVCRSELLAYLENNGFERNVSVQEKGEFAVRGGIIDIFSPNETNPFRLDFFGDEIETIRSFSAKTQKTIQQHKELLLLPMSEVVLNEETVRNFRRNYVQNFGAAERNDALYQSISNMRRFSGVEHWLPLFYENVDTLFDYIQGPIIVDYLAKEAFKERYALIKDYFEARKNQTSNALDESPYKAIIPSMLYLDDSAFDEGGLLEKKAHLLLEFTPFQQDDSPHKKIVHAHVQKGQNFLTIRQKAEGSLFAKVVEYLEEIKNEGRKILITGWSEGSLTRLLQVLEEYGLKNVQIIEKFAQFEALDSKNIAMAILPIEYGFETKDFILLTEQDILGDRLITPQKKRKKNSNMITNEQALEANDLVVHIDHGIGRFIGLKTIEVLGAKHDCLELHYAGNDRLYLPVENIELLSRYSGPKEQAVLDKIGGAAWQARKAKLKKRLLELADHFIAIAAKRQLKKAPILEAPQGLYDEFVARFPYEETSDQLEAIEATLEDMRSGKPMDRLICGDVGFGKTEVALRAAFVCAMNGYQTAVVVPTTLLARQHTQTFLKRFHGLPINIAQISRFTSAKERKIIETQLSDGTLDIVIGTHALLRDGLNIKNLALFIVDEEQHFGVKHKEKLKEFKSSVHVLTLSATPIPRTLQLALTGVRELSLIASPPVDRLAVRTFVSPFDALTIRETLLREYYRGGQSFYVCPRISDLDYIEKFLAESVPELKIAVAHGQLPTKLLDDIMNAFYDKQYNVLLATTIIESGLDIPSANTMIIHRADMFGLAALYQIRGRIGRSKQRGYALLTVPQGKILVKAAEKRLKIIQSLDSLGMGFQLASHDMDLRGTGNLLGEEQSGHIKEVGFALYQQMLEEAIAQIQDKDYKEDSQWSPQINLGLSVLIPESYVPDLDLRLQLYRRLALLETIQSVDAFGAELIDRFGILPIEVQHLLKIVCVKLLCKKANIEKVDAGDRGAVIYFKDNEFSNPAALLSFIAQQGHLAKIRPDQAIVFIRNWSSLEQRLTGTATIVKQVEKLLN